MSCWAVLMRPWVRFFLTNFWLHVFLAGFIAAGSFLTAWWFREGIIFTTGGASLCMLSLVMIARRFLRGQYNENLRLVGLSDDTYYCGANVDCLARCIAYHHRYDSLSMGVGILLGLIGTIIWSVGQFAIPRSSAC